MRNFLIDMRWDGTGGIGTFAREINRINNYADASFSGKPYSPVDSFRTTFRLIKDKNKVIFFPGYIPPIFSASPYIFTIHDLNHLDRPENSSYLKKIFYNYIIKRGCYKAKYIFTVSEFSKQRIINWSGVKEDKVINVGNGVSSIFTPQGESMNYEFEYILCVSNRKEHKNELKTIESFKESGLYRNMKLVFTGKPSEDILKNIAKLNISDRVYFTGYLDDDELPKLYRGARALVFVSLYEGFGLPVVEAMACGIPVVTSKTTSLGEISGNAALLVDPTDSNQISKALICAVTDEPRRKKLINAGLIHVKQYAWINVAQKVDFYLKKLKEIE